MPIGDSGLDKGKRGNSENLGKLHGFMPWDFKSAVCSLLWSGY